MSRWRMRVAVLRMQGKILFRPNAGTSLRNAIAAQEFSRNARWDCLHNAVEINAKISAVCMEDYFEIAHPRIVEIPLP